MAGRPPLKEVTEADFAAIAAEAEAARAERESRQQGAGQTVFLLSVLLALGWIVGVGVGAYVLMGAAALAALPVGTAVGLGALAVLPALMVGVAGATAREGAKARAEARRLADAADQLLAPAPGAEAATRRLAVAVRGEIAALDRALEQTLARIKSVEGEIAKQSSAVDHIAHQARQGADHMILGMERERAELLRISQELAAQATNVGQSIARHTGSITEAARRAETEVRAADEALDARITSFGAAAALITDRTQALTKAAQASADSALKLESALSNALDVLAKATHLTDAARESAQAASLAANTTATSINKTTSRAVEDARRAAEAIRGEAASIERQAGDALDRLRDAANSARGAAEDVRSAAAPAPQPPPPQQRPGFLRSGPVDPNRMLTMPPKEPAPRPEPRPDPRAAPSLFGEPGQTPRPQAPPPQARPQGAPPQPGWTWRELLSNMDEDDAASPTPPPARSTPRPAPTAPAPRVDEGDRVVRLAPEARTASLPVTASVERAGVRLNEVFSRGALDRIAQRARSGTQARRQAVRAAAPDAVNAVADYLDRDANARQDAAAFLKADGARIAELLGRGRAAMTAEATRAFLLIDAASS